VPDISALGDTYTGMAIGTFTFNAQGAVSGYAEQPVGGTSLATPLVAGTLADAEQDGHSFGFINPTLYALAKDKSGAFNDALPLTSASPASDRGVACDESLCGALSLITFDDESWSMQGYTGQVTAPGYDTMTGVGTPNAQRLIPALRGR
jgi:subtilase family serine protease